MNSDQMKEQMLERAADAVARLRLMNEIGAFAYCRLSEQEIQAQLPKYVPEATETKLPFNAKAVGRYLAKSCRQTP